MNKMVNYTATENLDEETILLVQCLGHTQSDSRLLMLGRSEEGSPPSLMIVVSCSLPRESRWVRLSSTVCVCVVCVCACIHVCEWCVCGCVCKKVTWIDW